MISQQRVQPLPSDTAPYKHQVAGHFKTKESSPALLRSCNKPIVYKAFQDDYRGMREVLFYERLFHQDANKLLQQFQSFVPAYYGVFQCSVTQTLYLGLSDVLSNVRKPNVCDIKLGTVGYPEDATETRKQLEEAKYAWRRELGFLISGMQVFDPERQKFIKFAKMFLRSLNAEQIFTIAVCSFLGLDAERRVRLARAYLAKLTPLHDWLQSGWDEQVRFCRSSILLVHSGDRGVGQSGRNGSRSTWAGEETVEMRLIDFANSSIYEPGHDGRADPELVTGVRHGIVVLMEMMRKVAEGGADQAVPCRQTYDEILAMIEAFTSR